MKYSEHAIRIKKLAGLLGTDGSSESSPPPQALSTAPTPPGRFQGTDMRPNAANQAPGLENPILMTAKQAADMMTSPLGPNQGAFMRQAGQAGAPAPRAPVRTPAPQPTRAGIPTPSSLQSSFPTKTSQDHAMATTLQHTTTGHFQSTREAGQLIDRLVKGAALAPEPGLPVPGDAADRVHPPVRKSQDQLIAESKGKVASQLIDRLVKGAALLGDQKGTPQEARDALSADFLGMGHPSDAADRIKPGVGKSQDQLIAESKGKTAGVLGDVGRGFVGGVNGFGDGAVQGLPAGLAIGGAVGILKHLLFKRHPGQTLAGDALGGMALGGGTSALIGGLSGGIIGAADGANAGKPPYVAPVPKDV